MTTHSKFKTYVIKRVAPVYYGIQERLPLTWRRYFVHAVRHRRLLHLRQPRTFSEKLAWRMVYDRRDMFRPTCDKMAMKELARERVGDVVRVPQTIWTGTNVAELASVDLPEHWIIKPNHRSGLVHFGHGAADVAELVRVTDGWLDEENWQKMGEWAYSFAESTLVVEELIGEPGQSLLDYKFDVFDGVVRTLVIHAGRFENPRRYIFYRDFTRVQAQFVGDTLDPDENFEKPKDYDRMIEAAERIAAGFDYLRVDLYYVGGEIWFGETTPYQGNATHTFRPADWDRQLGEFWTLPRL